MKHSCVPGRFRLEGTLVKGSPWAGELPELIVLKVPSCKTVWGVVWGR